MTAAATCYDVMKYDFPLVMLLLLLAATLILFIVDIFPYPFGLLILLIALLGRILVLTGRPQREIRNK